MSERERATDRGAGRADADRKGPSGGDAGPEGTDRPATTRGVTDRLTGRLFRQPLRHEAPAPLEGPIVGTVIGGTAAWFVLFLAQLPFYGWFDDHGHAWWIWTCLTGGGLGLFGIWYVRRRDAAIRQAASRD